MMNQIEEKRTRPGSMGRGPGMHYDLRRCDFYHTDYIRLFGRRVTRRRKKQEGSGLHMACLKALTRGSLLLLLLMLAHHCDTMNYYVFFFFPVFLF